MQTVMNVLHVVSAVFLIGPMAILPMTAMRSLRAGQHTQVASLAKTTQIFTLLSLLVVVFGFGLQGMYSIPLTTPWILYSIIAYVVALALNLFLVVPAMRKAAAGADNGKAGSYPQIAAGSGVVSLLLVVVVVLMTWQP